MGKSSPPTTYVGFVIDRSGSMSAVRSQAIEAHNSQLQDIRKAASDQDVRVIRTIFDDPDEIDVSEAMPLEEAPNLTYETFVPRGSTALLDAMGDTITKLRGFKLRKKDAVLLVVVTDGEENSSTRFSGEQIRSLVKDLESTGQWTVTFLGANVNPYTISQTYGVKLGNTATYTSSPVGVAAMSSASNASTSAYFNSRASGVTSSPTYYNNVEDAPADFTVPDESGVTFSNGSGIAVSTPVSPSASGTPVTSQTITISPDGSLNDWGSFSNSSADLTSIFNRDQGDETE